MPFCLHNSSMHLLYKIHISKLHKYIFLFEKFVRNVHYKLLKVSEEEWGTHSTVKPQCNGQFGQWECFLYTTDA